ncbi:MAG TPA: PstS family phosphate ABC transporter substrate-binding protein, partial [Anaerolineales bacterium]|nr:PstS family phosphate ABC transporter substrate-binding protein [Anaerolineales bacterium]
ASDPMAMYEPAAVTGDIIAAGSSTVFPLSEAVAELFRDEGYGGNLTIDSIGSGAGLERFCKTGETDIANASRAIKDSEVESCRAIGREPLEIRVGTDGLAVVVNTANTFLTDITKEQLALAFSTAETWADVDPSWPAEPILRFSPGTDSGTFDYFVEVVMNPKYVVDAAADAGKGEEALLNASNLQLSEDDNVLVQGVEGSQFAIGYFGYAYYQENADRLTVLAVDGVAPSAETVDGGTYGLARPLYMYTTAEILQEKPQVAAFIYFYLTRVNEVIDEVGYFPATQDALDASLQAWSEAIGM